RISVMGGQQAASVLLQVRLDNLHREDRDMTHQEREAFTAPTLAAYEAEGNPYFSTARLWDDGVIDPVYTRMVLGLGLSAALNADIPETRFG
ncbi:carboxyl transferase domain-containing protein, partial [Klebsiella pneumoniae]|uniref:carboxyl transferase domain-containing protein n=1 Tax=Klebsiella pneumoniae TaxID=573 RepID=UPI003013CEDB